MDKVGNKALIARKETIEVAGREELETTIAGGDVDASDMSDIFL